jgi:hypothetical protein
VGLISALRWVRFTRSFPTFVEEKRNLSDRLTAPFAERIAVYLQGLFGPRIRVNVRMDDNGCSGLSVYRPEAESGETFFSQLSVGAREQVAAATRLAMAELLATAHDGCLPVVFDDSFVNADPERLAGLQRMLDLAAQRGLQVIVLSCTPADYSRLGAATVLLSRDNPTLPAGRSFTPQSPVAPDTTDGDDDPAEEPVTVTGAERELFLLALKNRGGSEGNKTLRENLGWSSALYNAVKASLLDSDQIQAGRGRGGSVSLRECPNSTGE